MKKTVLIFALTVLMVFSAFGAYAANYYPVKDVAENYSYTVKCDVSALADDATAVVNGESMYGLVAVIGTGDSISLTSADSYVYIDQAKIDKDGYVTFEGFLPKGATPDAVVPETGAVEGEVYFEECTLFIGGPGFTTAKQIGVLKDASSLPITGTIVDTASNANSTRVATIKVLDASGSEVSSVTVKSGAYTVSAPAGTGYKVVISKPGFCTYTFTGVDVIEEVDLGETDISVLAGNANGSEIAGINYDDLSAVLANYYAENVTDVVDVNGSGAVNFDDLSLVLGNYYAEHITNNIGE